MPASTTSIDQLAINTIRTLSMDAVEKAEQRPSRHADGPGPGGLSAVERSPALRSRSSRFGPAAIASCFRAGMLRCCSIRCFIWRACGRRARKGTPRHEAAGGSSHELAVSLEEIKRFRQLHSRTPGHPEHGETAGVETTTGPLGQGCGNSVGMAIAQAWLAARYNRPGFELFDYNVYVHLQRRRPDGRRRQRGRLARRASAGSRTCAGFTTTTTSRSKAQPRWPSAKTWRRAFAAWAGTSRRVADANDLAVMQRGARRLQTATDKPTLIIVRSLIAWGAPKKQDTARRPRRAAGGRRSPAPRRPSTAGRPTSSSRARGSPRTLSRNGVGAARPNGPRAVGSQLPRLSG